MRDLFLVCPFFWHQVFYSGNGSSILEMIQQEVQLGLQVQLMTTVASTKLQQRGVMVNMLVLTLHHICPFAP
jgi:hypothetical protein